jgi:hypothetical protein
MKNRKWLTYTLGTLLTLVVLAVVAGISFRIGMTRNPSFARPAFSRGFNGMPQEMQRNFQNNDSPQGPQGNFRNNDGPQKMHGDFRGNGWTQMQGDPRNQGYANRGYNSGGDRHGGKMSFFFPFIFGLVHLVVLGLILWAVYVLVKNSGWSLTRVQEAAPAPAPLPSETTNVVADKKKKLK